MRVVRVLDPEKPESKLIISNAALSQRGEIYLKKICMLAMLVVIVVRCRIQRSADDFNSGVPSRFDIEFPLYFSSNRATQGGSFDVESFYVDGPTINTASDEFRPAILFAEDFTNDLMLFSSNRPRGRGGFDLYSVGIPKMTQ